MVERVFRCPPQKSGKPSAASTCIKAFAASLQADLVKTVSDGNCFFDSLLLSHTIPLPLVGAAPLRGAEAQRQYLRDALVDYLLDHVSPNIMPAANIEQLYQSGMYACDAGDLVPVYAPLAFGIRLHLFDLHTDSTGHYVVTLHRYGEEGPVVHIIRAGEHFQLLRPRDAHAQNAKNAKNATRKAQQAANAALARKLAQLNLNENATRKAQHAANATLARKLAQMNLNENTARMAQEEENRAYAQSQKGGSRRVRTRKTRR